VVSSFRTVGGNELVLSNKEGGEIFLFKAKHQDLSIIVSRLLILNKLVIMKYKLNIPEAVHYLITKKKIDSKSSKRGDLCLHLTNFEPNVKKLALNHQAQPSH
jgi:hypothetical protein